MKPAKSNISILNQICQLIPGHLVNKLSKKHKIQSRGFSPWSHVLSLLYAQVSHSMSLNDICDSLQNHQGTLNHIRGATAPRKNTLSHANRNRNAAMAEDLFWSVLSSLQKQDAMFGAGYNKAMPRRFRRRISVVDSTTIALVANSLDWAKHRRRKAAAKCHMNLNLQSFLPSYAIVKEASTHDSTEAIELCSRLESGEIVIFDKAYIDFDHLYQLEQREVFFVSRSKDNMSFEVVEESSCTGAIVNDWKVKLLGKKSLNDYQGTLRLVEADVLVNDEIKRMRFMTNNFNWAASSICDLYKSRWGIEVFFKQIKQSLQLSNFLGYNKNAMQWQIWTALLAYILLRFIAHQSQWSFSFMRIYTLLRAVLWSYMDIKSVIESCGTAKDPPANEIGYEQPLLPGFN